MDMESVLGLMIGIGLSAACGFRVFVPLWGMSVAQLSGHLTASPGFEWIGTWPACLAFATATCLEVAGYYVPWIDNLLDTGSTPVAIVAATILTASQLGDLSPFLKWSLAVIAGGGVSTLVQSSTVTLRAASTGTTGGLGNFVIATGELLASSLTTVLALVVPVVCFVLVMAFCLLAAWQLARYVRQRSQHGDVARQHAST